MVSIIVPIYNVGQYLRTCLDSICMQTYKDIEIILIDDGSTDGCCEICEEYKNRDLRIKVLHKRNAGLVRARKDGLKIATGQYISYVDGDDWVEPDMIERLYNIIEKESTDIVMCGRYEDTENSSRKVFHGIDGGRYDKEALLRDIYPKMIVNGAFFEWGLFPGVWDKLFKRECLEPFQMLVDDRLTLGEDAACTYPCLLNADSIYVLRDCLYHYRQTPFSMVKKIEDIEPERQRFRILYESVCKLLGKYCNVYDLRKQWQEYMLFLMVARADILYEGIETLDYLFPFPEIKKGSNIIIYGAGTYGQRLYSYLNHNHFCTVIAMADRNCVELQKQGLPVIAPEKIADYEYDAIVITISFAKARSIVYRELKRAYPKSNIYTIDERLIKSKETRRAIGFEE